MISLMWSLASWMSVLRGWNRQTMTQSGQVAMFYYDLGECVKWRL